MLLHFPSLIVSYVPLLIVLSFFVLLQFMLAKIPVLILLSFVCKKDVTVELSGNNTIRNSCTHHWGRLLVFRRWGQQQRFVMIFVLACCIFVQDTVCVLVQIISLLSYLSGWVLFLCMQIRVLVCFGTLNFLSCINRVIWHNKTLRCPDAPKHSRLISCRIFCCCEDADWPAHFCMASL